MGKATTDATSTDVATTNDAGTTIADTITDDLTFKSFTELMSMFEDGGVTNISELDDTVTFDKADLVNQPLIITGFREGKAGEYGNSFVVVKCVTRQLVNGEVKDLRGIFTDGSTGIKEQLMSFVTVKGVDKPIYCPKGLKASSYTYTDPFTLEKTPAVTYYLNNEQ